MVIKLRNPQEFCLVEAKLTKLHLARLSCVSAGAARHSQPRRSMPVAAADAACVLLLMAVVSCERKLAVSHYS